MTAFDPEQPVAITSITGYVTARQPSDMQRPTQTGSDKESDN